MKTWIVVFLLASCAGCAHQDSWTTQDTVLQSIYTATLVVDAIQTSEIQYHPDLEEGGVIARSVLGRNPSTSDTWQYFGSLAVTNYLVSRALPARWRPWWQGANIAHQTTLIFSNCAHGLGRICAEE